jgi:hypothetical protein
MRLEETSGIIYEVVVIVVHVVAAAGNDDNGVIENFRFLLGTSINDVYLAVKC